MKLVVFDSGEGCKFVAKKLKQVFRKWEIITYEDRKNFPYGKKSRTELKIVIQKTIDEIYGLYKPDAILIASYTPSLQIFHFLKSKSRLFKMDLPFIKNSAILVTDGLAKSETYLQKIKGKNITTVPISSLANLIQNNESRRKIKNEIFNKLKRINSLKVVLGCTHLPSVLDIFRKVKPETNFIDPVEELIKNLKKIN